MTSTVPADPTGMPVTPMRLSAKTPKKALLAPKWTAVAPVKLAPVTYTAVAVPPAAVPLEGLTAVTVGAGGGDEDV